MNYNLLQKCTIICALTIGYTRTISLIHSKENIVFYRKIFTFTAKGLLNYSYELWVLIIRNMVNYSSRINGSIFREIKLWINFAKFYSLHTNKHLSPPLIIKCSSLVNHTLPFNSDKYRYHSLHTFNFQLPPLLYSLLISISPNLFITFFSLNKNLTKPLYRNKLSPIALNVYFPNERITLVRSSQLRSMTWVRKTIFLLYKSEV